jgi:intracellular septation protein A
MAARVKQQNIIYSSLAESMLDGEIKIDDNYWSLTNNIISIIAITTTIVNAMLIVKFGSKIFTGFEKVVLPRMCDSRDSSKKCCNNAILDF